MSQQQELKEQALNDWKALLVIRHVTGNCKGASLLLRGSKYAPKEPTEINKKLDKIVKLLGEVLISIQQRYNAYPKEIRIVSRKP